MKKIWIIPVILLGLLTACNAPQQSALPADTNPVIEDVAEVPTTAPEVVAEVAEPAAESTEAVASPSETESSESVTTESEPSVAAESVSAPDQSAELSDAEESALLYMREEEKLARDTYLAMYDIWGLQIFQNIANSEQAHTDSVKTLIDRYGLQDQFSSEPGVFYDATLQDLYDQLIEQGSRSLADALLVGGAIEEIDILDLQESLEEVKKEDIRQVFENLLRGSYNHLRAFTSTYQTQTGETYAPQYMTAEAYQAAITTQAGGGPGRRGRP